MTCLGIVKMVEHVFTTPSNVLAHRDFMDKTAPKGFNLFDVLNIWIFGPTSPIINDIDMSLNIYSYMLQILYWVCKSEGTTAHRLQVFRFIFHHQHHQGDIFWSSYPSPSSSDALCLLVDPMEANQFIRWTTNISNLLRIHRRQFYMNMKHQFY